MSKLNSTEEPNEFFRSFVLSNIGVLERAKSQPEELTYLLKHVNSK
jgi:hypothetical protein